MYFKTVYNVLNPKVGRVNNRTLGLVRRTSITSLVAGQGNLFLWMALNGRVSLCGSPKWRMFDPLSDFVSFQT